MSMSEFASRQQESQSDQLAQAPVVDKPPRQGGGKRIPLSCLACRQHKLRCDRRVPCGTCIRYRREAQCRENPAPSQRRGAAIGASIHRAVEDRRSSTGAAVISHVQQGIEALETRLYGGDAGYAGRPTAVQSAHPLSDRAGSSPSQNFTSFVRLLGLNEDLGEAPPPSLPQILAEANREKHLSSWWSFLDVQHRKRVYRQQLSAALPTRSQCDLLANYYLEHVNWIFQTIHVPSFRRDYVMFWDTGMDQADLIWLSLLFTVISRHLGQAIRNAQAIGLDRDTTPSTCLEDEMRHRLWWDLVDADMFQTICLDREPLVRLKDPGVPLPLNCDDHDMTASSIHPKPLDVPTVMSMNIYRAQAFRILNRHFCATHGDCLQSLEGVRRLDAEIVELVTQLPWYFQLDEDGNPPRLPEPLHEILTWQNHILRTCVSTQRIRMYRPFLATHVEDVWENVVKAAEDALAVYRTLRLDRATTSRQKFSTQAYQVFSVAVTVAALLLVEGSLPIPDAYNLIKDMAMDLRMLENQGCLVPVATHGHQVLLKMLAFFDRRWTDPVSPEDAKRLVPDISIILGGESTTRAYMDRLSSQAQPRTPTRTISAAGQQIAAGDVVDVRTVNNESGKPAEETEITPESLMDSSCGDMMEGIDPELFLENIRPLGLLDWDMTGLLVDIHGK
ncbi:hypothetical protein ACKAV7_008430 [Fusarium commune]